MYRLKLLLAPVGIALILWGYRLLAVPPETLYDEVLLRARNGMGLVIGGGALLMLWLMRR